MYRKKKRKKGRQLPKENNEMHEEIVQLGHFLVWGPFFNRGYKAQIKDRNHRVMSE